MSATNFDSVAVKSADNITAGAGGGRANAVSLSASANRIAIVTTAADSALLPALTVGESAQIWNAGANSMQVFPRNATDTINGVVGTTGVPLAAGKSAVYTAYSAGVIGANVSA